MRHPWTSVYGVARSLLALGLLATLLCNGIDVLFQPAAFKTLHQTSPTNRIGLFYLLSGSRAGLEAARWIAVGLLAVVVSGWRPRYTGVLHWWLSFSFSVATTVAEGGDQINAILTLLLVPVTLMDPRRWHWAEWTPDLSRVGPQIRALVAASCLTVIRLQVAVIYFHAGITKLSVPEWSNGTAIYYWFTHPVYGMNDPIKALAMPALASSVGVTVLTWGVIFVELLLASALVMDKRYYPKLLIPGVAFHGGIVIAHGLASFFFAMAGALVLYLRPAERVFSLRRFERVAQRLHAIGAAVKARVGRSD
jgi:antimicrobial peptide system SdpB family protein